MKHFFLVLSLLLWNGCALPSTLPREIPVYHRASLQGPAVVHLWAPWCTVCLHEMEELEKLAPYAQTQGVPLYAIAIDTSQADVENYLQEHPTSLIVLSDIRAIAKNRYKVRGIPLTFVIDERGNALEFEDPWNNRTTTKLLGERIWFSREGRKLIDDLAARKKQLRRTTDK